MILVDFNGTVIATVFAMHLDVEEDLIRHAVLNTLRMFRKKFRDHGELVICCDGGSWRKDAFPQYKHKRAGEREASSLDWDKLFEILNRVLDDIRENFPYKVVKVYNAEADDVIATIVERTQEFGHWEDVMIISTDKDFAQLQKYSNVKQYSPVQKKFIVEKNPRKTLFEHICKGDSVDSVPNVMSPDNTFVDGIRQNKMMSKKIEEWQAAEDLRVAMGEEIYRNYLRNKKVIDLSEVPSSLAEKILNTYDKQQPANPSKVMPFLMKNRMRVLLENYNDFIT